MRELYAENGKSPNGYLCVRHSTQIDFLIPRRAADAITKTSRHVVETL